ATTQLPVVPGRGRVGSFEMAIGWTDSQPARLGSRSRRGSMPLVTAVACGLFLLSAPDGRPSGATRDPHIRPLQGHVPQAALDDLRRRIAATRWPDKETVADRSQGVQLARLQELARYWGSGYDWRKAEAKLNALPQFITNIDGVDIHFIHVRSRH